ncbi:MAG: phosphatase PAP2 family protein [Bacteroidales bacterium]|nr:phosphatase PAP2 family protein [Bacteroidales bacterium]MCM1146849.1 phosphatase PAP2 family protein [Bacteroidales bacterium]MCM1205653.1 phosphatase PAP2 family protein [Bacillota bacterium]MCM1510235.1 phosphatase PAP2 family protein [Clostridium sp.]
MVTVILRTIAAAVAVICSSWTYAGTAGMSCADSSMNGDSLPHCRNFLGEECLDMGKKGKYYGWKRDVTYAGVPIVLSAIVVKEEKQPFSPTCTVVTSNGRHELENYTRFAPYALIAGLKLAGYEGRSDWPRFVTSALASNVIMAAAVSVAKRASCEPRPDNSDTKSFPSGHAATAFAAATVIHKEYGMTRSPWFSVGGYAVATGTSVLRVAHNRHWVSDVMAGAGIGIMSAELGYFVSDLIYGNRGLQRLELSGPPSDACPSFMDVQMGVGLHPGTMHFPGNDGMEEGIGLCTSTVAGIEGAYFPNRNIGFGGMARVTVTPADIPSLAENYGGTAYIDDNTFTDVALDAGVYGNLPIGRSISLGAKMLCGVRLSDGISVMKDSPSSLEVMRVRGGSAVNWVAGISASWRYRENFAWKIFADVDMSKCGYTYTRSSVTAVGQAGETAMYAGLKKQMTYFTIGGAFSVRF